MPGTNFLIIIWSSRILSSIIAKLKYKINDPIAPWILSYEEKEKKPITQA